MPGYDRTGPWGQGSRTGGGFGVCGAPAQEAEADALNYGRGFGSGGGRGLQRGFRRGFCFFGRGRGGAGYGARRVPEAAPPDLAKPSLEAEAAELRRRLDAIEQRLAGMGAGGAEFKSAS
jgi:hypothetical protein